jgi:hypothetical protein
MFALYGADTNIFKWALISAVQVIDVTVRFKFRAAYLMRIQVFWEVTPCRLLIIADISDERIASIYRVLICLTLEMEALLSSVIVMVCQSTWVFMQYMHCFTLLVLWTSSANVSYKRSLMSSLFHMQIYFLKGLRILTSQYNTLFLFLAWPISAGPTLRSTFCQRCVVRRVSGRLKNRSLEPDKRSQWQ